MTAGVASLSGARIAGALALASAGLTLGSAGYALAFVRPLGSRPEDRLGAAAFDRRQAPLQARIHLLLSLTHLLMMPALLRRLPGAGTSIAPACARATGATAEALMLAAMVTQARAWRNVAYLYGAAAWDEEQALDQLAEANTARTETAGVALWAVSAAAAAVSLRRHAPGRAALSAAASLVWTAQVIRPSEAGRALSFAARIILCGASGAVLLSAGSLSSAGESATGS